MIRIRDAARIKKMSKAEGKDFYYCIGQIQGDMELDGDDMMTRKGSIVAHVPISLDERGDEGNDKYTANNLNVLSTVVRRLLF